MRLQSIARKAFAFSRRIRGVLAIAALLSTTHAIAGVDSRGTDFWLMFPANLGTPALTLFITGDVATNGVVSVPGLAFSAPFSVVPGTVTSVLLPSGTEVTAVNTVTNQGIHLVSNAEVAVYGLSRVQFTTDAFLGLPTDILGTDYINLGYKNVGVVNASQFGIVATQAGTVVTITPSAVAGVRTANTPYTVVLDQGQTYLLRSTASAPADLTGSLIKSTAPIGVFGGHQCANIPTVSVVACDYIVEQLPPTTTWGKAFVTMPLATRLKGDTFRMLASVDGTVVSINGAVVATLNRGQFHEQLIVGPSQITSSQPILVAQYSNGTSFDNVTSDPFEMLVPPYEQFLAAYTVTTPASGFTINYINVVAPNAAVGSVRLDGVVIPAAEFTAIPGSTFSGTQRAVSLGAHTLAAALPFGTFVYGFASADSYGYPGGMSLSQVAVVSTLTLTPKAETVTLNTQACVAASLRDQNNAPVPSVRVDFTVTGVNPITGFVNANAAGIAQYCYTGTHLGGDSIVASVGTLNDRAAKTWVAAAALACDVDGNGVVDRTDLSLIQAGIGQTPSASDPRDANRDGKITINDVRYCALRLTAP